MFVNLKSALSRLGLLTGSLLVLGVSAGATANDASTSNWEAQNESIQDGNIKYPRRKYSCDGDFDRHHGNSGADLCVDTNT